MHDVDPKTFPVVQCIILPNFTTFRQIVKHYFANSFWGSVHECTIMKIGMHDARRRLENIPSTSMYHPIEFDVILSNSLTVFCTLIFGGLCTCAGL